MNDTYILLFLLITCWTLNPFLKKQMTGKLNADEYMIYNHSICSILIAFYLGYLIYKKNYSINSIKSLTKKDVCISILGGFITVASSILLITLLQKNDTSYIIPHVQPCIIILTLIIGYMFFGESLTKNKMIGTGLITLGLIFMNKK